jgi:prenyltransferase beta subunit
LARTGRLLQVFLCLFSVVLACPSWSANTPEVTNGLTWLQGQVTPTGALQNEAQSIATPLQARAEAALALQLLSTTLSAQLVTAVGAETEDVSEYLARKAIVLNLAGSDTRAILTALQSNQNADGGFAPMPGFASDPYDSAWAVIALNQLGQGPSQSAGLARSFLQSLQQADGGIGTGTDKQRLIETAFAVLALRSGTDQVSQAAVQAGVNYLKLQQLPDASWGSELYATVSVWLAISPDISVAADRDRVASYLKAAQLADGSWADDPFLTALVLRALTANAAIQPPVAGSLLGRIVEQGSITPLGNATVSLSGTGTVPAVTTGADGHFAFANLAAGSYSLTITKAGYQSASAAVTLAGGQQLQLADILLAVSATTGVIRGQITDGVARTALAGVVVTTSNSPALTATTGSDGGYEIVNVPPGTLQISAAKSGYLTASGSGTAVAGTSLLFSAALYANGTTPPTQGTVVGKVVAAGSQAPLANVSVTVNGAARAATAADGTFSITLNAGTYAVAYNLAGYQSVTSTLILTAGTRIDAGMVVLSPQRTTTRISGHVTQLGGAALGGAAVQLQGGATLTTGVDGSYVLDGLTGSSFTFTASAAGYITQSLTLQVGAPSDLIQDFVLIPQGQALVQIAALTVTPATVGANADVVATTTLLNPNATAVALGLILQVRDANDKVVGQGSVVNASGQALGILQVAAGAQIPLRATWNSGRYAPGTYTLVLRAIAAGTATSQDPDGQVLGEGRGQVAITRQLAIAGSVTASPPVLRVGSSFSVKLSSTLQNAGNDALPAQSYQLVIVNTQSNAQAYTQNVPGPALNVGELATLVFPDWTPTLAGNYSLQVSGPSGVQGSVTTTVYVGDSPAASYTVDKSTVPIGNQTAKGSITVQGIDPATAALSDPLAPLIRSATQQAVTFGDATAANWTTTNRCTACHMQSQALVGGELTRNLTTYDASQRTTIFNALATFQQADGGIDMSYPGNLTTQAMLGSWALNAWHKKDEILLTLSRAADFIIGRQTTAGNWNADHTFAWWPANSTITAFNVKNLVETQSALKQAPAGSVVNYSRNLWISGNGFNGTYDLASDAQNNVYVSNYWGGTVLRVRPDGLIEPWMKGLFGPRGIAVAADGTVYAATEAGLVRRNANGTQTTVVPNRGTTVTIGPDGNAYMTWLNQIYLITTPQGPQSQLTTYLAGGLLNGPRGMTFSPSGDLIVTNYDGMSIVRAKPDKTVDAVVAWTNGYAQSVKRYGAGWLVVTSNGLYRYNDEWQGERLTFTDPSSGLAVTPDGRIIVSDGAAAIYNVVAAPLASDARLTAIDVSINKGVAWLLNDANISTTSNLEIAHRLIGLTAARKYYTDGTANATAVQAKMDQVGSVLRSHQNSNGGWGGIWYAPGNTSNSLSDSLVTAQVFYALDALNPSASSQQVRNSIQWLLSRQQADGSWISENNIMTTKEGATSWVAIALRSMLDRLGSIDTNLTLAFPPNVLMSNAVPAATTAQTLPSGETLYNWAFTGVTASGLAINFDLGLQNMQPGENRAVSSEAYLTFRNTFTGENQVAPLSVPVIYADDGIDLAITPDQPAYPANSVAQLPTTLNNRNPAAENGTLTVTVTDSNGVTVLQIVNQAVSVTASAALTVPGTFNVGTALVGHYQVQATLVDAGNRLLAQGTTQFDILPDQTPLAAMVSTDKAVYQSRDLVSISGRVYNRASNVILSNYSVRETVTDAIGQTLFTSTRAILQVGAMSFVDLPFSFRLNNVPAGTYTVRQEVMDAGGVLQNTQTAVFQVQASNLTGASLRGFIGATPKQLQRGELESVAYTLTNLGNSDYAALPITVTIVDPVAQTILQSSPSTLPLAQLASAQGSVTWDTGSVAPPAPNATGLTTYVVVLSANAGGQTIALSQDSFLVGDLQPFAFAPQTDVPLTALTSSNAVTLKGIAATLPVSISGGQYSVNGGAYTGVAGSVKNGDVVTVQQTSSNGYGVKTTATLTVGSFSAPFDVTTLQNTTPSAFAFAPQVDVPLSSLRTSNSVTISAITVPVPISVTGGTYSINAGAFTSAAGTVKSGDQVVVQATSAASYGVKTSAVLTVSTVSALFDVTTLQNTTPTAFTFTPQIDVPLSSLRTSNSVTISAITVPVPISITGGAYSVNGGPFTVAAGTVKSGDQVTVQEISSPSYATKTSAVLTVSAYSAPFSVTTLQNTTPMAFTFTPQIDVPLSSLRTSNSVTISAITVPVPISITVGQYSINGGPFTAASGTVKSGDQVVVQQTSSPNPGVKTSAVLTVGTYSTSFDVTTINNIPTPGPFAFAAQTGAPLLASRSSNPITVTLITVAVPVSITGGTYSINGGPYTSSAGTVKAGDVITVQLTSAGKFNTLTTAILTVSNVSGGFSVTTKAVADVATTEAFTADTRVLVLVSCKNSQGAADPACVASRASFLDTYLTTLGVEHRIVTDTETFRVEFRSGRYNTTWISGGADKLTDTLAEEVKQAVFRGDSLILDGDHDQRNGTLDEVIGITYLGKPPEPLSVALSSTFLPPGAFAIAGGALRLALTTGTRQAGFGAASGDAAIVANHYGQGHALQFAFDLTATLQASPNDLLLQALVDQALAYLVPVTPATYTGGAYVPFTIMLKNPEPVAVDLTVTVTLPQGATLASTNPQATVDALGHVVWQVTVGVGASNNLDFVLRAPLVSGTYAGSIAVDQTYNATSMHIGDTPFSFIVKGADQTLPQVIAELQAATPAAQQERQARDRAVADLQTAQSEIAQAQYANAIGALLTALGELAKVTSVNLAPQQVEIDAVIEEVALRWYAALPVCPATPDCRNP